MIGPVLVTAMLDIGTMMMELAGLSFLGLGAQIPMAEWGSNDERWTKYDPDISMGGSVAGNLRFLYRWLFLICWEIPSGITWIRRIAGSSDARQSEAEIRGFQNTILDSFVLSKRK